MLKKLQIKVAVKDIIAYGINNDICVSRYYVSKTAYNKAIKFCNKD